VELELLADISTVGLVEASAAANGQRRINMDGAARRAPQRCDFVRLGWVALASRPIIQGILHLVDGAYR
jgi:hypothetical protein